ncbi:MAG TPA: glyceraldehyde 3-phosphate dehydrogenase NAD-binding domain-containing protein [Solimonas sp.]|nr:glyceraldehyde 3-phosphate dehydrogenase NAD-binding domain-containing protein [Solimonas sp.]
MTKQKLNIGINGFGRIGRAVARILLERGEHRIVLINDLNTDKSNLAYLLGYDTTYGRLAAPVKASAEGLTIGDASVRVTHHASIADVPWKASGVDIVIESTGVSDNEKNARAISGSVPVLITNAAPSADFTLVFGATERQLDPSKHRVVSTSICDAIAAAPVLKALDEAFGVGSGFITTLHPWLSYQNLMDGPARSQAYPGATYSHYPLGRSSVGTLIPKPTTVVSACERILPQLAGRLKCMSYRVPTSCVSSGDMSLHLEKDTTEREVLEVLHALRATQQGRSVVRICDEPLVSVDFLKDAHSCIIDTRWLMLNRKRELKIVLWYDNEWGYSSRVVDAIDLMQ